MPTGLGAPLHLPRCSRAVYAFQIPGAVTALVQIRLAVFFSYAMMPLRPFQLATLEFPGTEMRRGADHPCCVCARGLAC